jgi:iron complex transport system substrate-binding protein
MKIQIICLIILSIFFSCGKKNSSSTNLQQSAETDASADSVVKITYAQGFSIDYFNNYKKITVKNPWKKGETQQVLYLVNDSGIVVPNNGVKIVVPVVNLAVGSTTYYGFLALLGEINSVKGACSVALAYNRDIIKNFENGLVRELGDAFNPNIEQIMMLQPQILMLPSYNQQDETVKRLKNAGVTVVYNNEWTENSLLARAEWLKFVAAFYNKESLADSIFSETVNKYYEAVKITENVAEKPTVIVGSNFKGTWYMPGGKSYMCNLITDAGGDYYFKNDTSTASLPMSFEYVLKNFHAADVWLNSPAETLEQLFAMDRRHRLFSAAKNGNVFAQLNRCSSSGANDFWESGVAAPDIILRDAIWALHPALLPSYQPVYILKCK